jgi:hypothetical protein
VYSYSDLSSEIREEITLRLNGKPEVPAEWIVNAIAQRHTKKATRLPEFFRFCTLEYLRSEVRKAVNRAKQADVEDEQLILPGYERLQVRYALERSGQACFVRLEAMTTQEIIAKAREYDRMGNGCFKHRDELMDYAQKRMSAAIA